MEIDEEKEKEIVDALADYCKTYKSTTGTGQSYPDLPGWITRNTDKYNIGRPNPNPKLRLGQWYINFKILFPDADVPDHPCK
jgi:hypothetical protein